MRKKPGKNRPEASRRPPPAVAAPMRPAVRPDEQRRKVLRAHYMARYRAR